MTLHKPQKDSPSTYLTTAIAPNDTTLIVADSSIFSAENITRLTLGYDTATTETVTVVSYGGANSIEVIRGKPAYTWASGTTKVARVLTAQDILDIHLMLTDLDAAKVQNRRRRVHLSSMADGPLSADVNFIHGPRLKYSRSDPKYASFNGVVPKDYLSDGILYVLISNYIGFVAVDAYINVGVTRFSIDSYLSGFMSLETTLTVPPMGGDLNYVIRTKAIPLGNIAPDDYIIGGVHLGSEAGENEVVYQGAYLDYMADS